MEAADAHELVETTVGRIIFNDVLPGDRVQELRDEEREHCAAWSPSASSMTDAPATADLADAIKRLGFTYATKAGSSIAISDVIVPPDREADSRQRRWQVIQLEEDFREGLITDNERYRQVGADLARRRTG